MEHQEPLIIFHKSSIVGQSSPDARGALSFQYSPEWLCAEKSFPISYALPLREEAYAPQVAHSFFANLLPEGGVRTQLASSLKLSESSDYQLLKEIGGECAGALQFFAESALQMDGRPPEEEDGKKILDGEDLKTILQRKSVVFMYDRGERLLRLSLAGAQHKLPVLFDPENGEIYTTNGRVPSTHILKIPNRDFKHLPENEFYLHLVAQKSGLDVPGSVLLRAPNTKKTHLLLNERYDRIVEEGEVKRLHQEDFCQALGIPPGSKYEKEGGPSLKDSIGLIRDISVEPAVDVNRFLDWVIFNLACGNSDAHGKNLSILYTNDGPRLSPFYDLVSTTIYDGIDKNMAMSIGGRSNPGQVGRKEWEVFAHAMGVGSSFLVKKVREKTGFIREAADQAWGDCRENFGNLEFLNQIRIKVHKQARRLGELL